jgi:hypothetical protein
VFAGLSALAATALPKDAHSVDFDEHIAVTELRDFLGPYQMPARASHPASAWYTFTAINKSMQPMMRVLLAGQPAVAALRIMPRPTRPAIASVASSEPSVTIKRARAFGSHAWQVMIPPATSAAFAVEVANAPTPPSLLAWAEPALAAHNKQLGIFIAAVAGLIFATVAIAAGLAVMSGHKAPLWAAITLSFILLMRLAGAGMFDASLATRVGGPYGLAALFAGLALVGGMRLTDTIVPLRAMWPWASRWQSWATT